MGVFIFTLVLTMLKGCIKDQVIVTLFSVFFKALRNGICVMQKNVIP